MPGAWLDVSPLDDTLDSGGFAQFERSYPLGVFVQFGDLLRRGLQFGGDLIDGRFATVLFI